MDALEKLKALDEQREKVLEEANSATLQKAQEAIKELSELGLHYTLVQESRAPKATAPRTELPEPKASPTFEQTLYGS